MDLVKSLAKQLDARRTELEQAQASLAQHRALLEQAKSELAGSNGDFGIWQQLDERVRFETRQVERYAGIVEQCSANVACAETALQNAQHYSEVCSLTASCDGLAKNTGPASLEKIRQLRDELRHELAAIDALQVEDEARCKRLQELGASREPYSVVASWLRAELVANPDSCLSSVGGFFGGGIPGGSLAGLLLTPSALVLDGCGPASRGQQLEMLTPRAERLEAPPEAAYVPPPSRTGTVRHSAIDAQGRQHEIELDWYSDRTKRVPSSLRAEARQMLSSPSEYMRASGEVILALPDVISVA